MDIGKARLTGANLNAFLRRLQIVKIDPLGRFFEEAVLADPSQLDILLYTGDPLIPVPGPLAEDESTVARRFPEGELSVCFPLTPDGHLAGTLPIRFDESLAVDQVIALVDVNMASEDKEEALAATWLGLGYHDHNHPADFGGVLRDASRPGPRQPKCCYVDVKLTEAPGVGSQRTKLEERAQQRKFGCMAQTVTDAADNGFAGYPGRGLPGLLATMLHNPVLAAKNHTGYAVNWFFGIRSNYQATAAQWGWGGSRGVRLPEPLLELLQSTRVKVGQEEKSLLTLLEEYRDYSQFRDEKGDWDRASLGATLKAKSIAARYLLMNEDPVLHAETTIANLTPADAGDMRLRLEDFHPGESFANYYARRAVNERRLRIEEERKADEERRLRIEEERKADEERRLRIEEERKADQAVRLLEEGMRKIDEERRLRIEEERKADEAVRLADEEKRKADEEKRKADEEKRTLLELLKQGKHEEAMQLLAKGLLKANPNDPT